MARHEHAALREDRRHSVAASQIQQVHDLTAQRQRELDDIQSKLSRFRLGQQKQEQQLRAAWSERNGQLWQRIEGVIKLEEDKARAQLYAEQQKREEETRKVKEAEQRAREEDERKLQEELRVRKEAQEREQQQEQEKAKQEQEKVKQEDEQRRSKEAEAQTAAHEQAVEAAVNNIGASTAAEDWKKGRDLLKVSLASNVNFDVTNCSRTETQERPYENRQG